MMLLVLLLAAAMADDVFTAAVVAAGSQVPGFGRQTYARTGSAIYRTGARAQARCTVRPSRVIRQIDHIIC